MATATAERETTEVWPGELAQIKDRLCAKAAVTGPKEWDDEADEYSDCEPAAEIARLLIGAKVHPDLGPLKIAYVWRKDPKSNGEQVWGKCSTVDRAAEQLAEAHERGEISDDDYQYELRAIGDALQQEAEEAAEQAYRDVMGYDGPWWY